MNANLHNAPRASNCVNITYHCPLPIAHCDNSNGLNFLLVWSISVFKWNTEAVYWFSEYIYGFALALNSDQAVCQ